MAQPTPALIDRFVAVEAQHRILRDVLLALVGTALLALSAKVQVSLIVPMTLQSLVVLVIGAVYGLRLGTLTLALYLLEGVAGLPVFAGTPEKGVGLAYMMGPTGGYLAGFVAAAAFVGVCAGRGWTRSIPGALAVMTAGHALIFAFGFAWLALILGAETAYLVGIAPFFAATLIKTALAAALLPAAHRLVR